jgi:hypothetical protein
MSINRSREAALAFMDYVGAKGLMAKATASARKAALGRVLSILSEDEAKDVTHIDVDELMTRFGHLEGKNYTPQSLVTYKSRVRSALDDFASYVDNPLAFKPSLQSRDRRPQPAQQAQKSQEALQEQSDYSQKSPVAAGPMASSILPIPIRADLTIHIQGLPFDLTPAEAKRIASVIQAMATPLEA